MPSRQELVAHDRDEDSIAKEIGADVIIYQVSYICVYYYYYLRFSYLTLSFLIKELDDLLTSCRKFNPNIKTFDCSVFNGEYVTGCVTPEYLDHLEKVRNDLAKNLKGTLHSPDTIGLHNNYGYNGKSPI
jgi:amidophosphoribosyltransferase